MELNKTQLGAAIRAHRLTLGYTQEYLAEKVDITVTHMKHLESGHRMPSVEVLYHLVHELHLSLDELWLPEQSSRPDAPQNKELELLLGHCSEKELSIVIDLVKSLIKNR